MDIKEKEIRDIASNQYNLISAVAADHLLSLIDQLRAERDEIREAWEPIEIRLNEIGVDIMDIEFYLRKLAKLIGKEKV